MSEHPCDDTCVRLDAGLNRSRCMDTCELSYDQPGRDLYRRLTLHLHWYVGTGLGCLLADCHRHPEDPIHRKEQPG